MYPSSNFKESSWDKERKGKKNEEGGRVGKKGKRRREKLGRRKCADIDSVITFGAITN